jgi:hypothetical protein
MKKYILTESQIRNLINNVVDENKKIIPLTDDELKYIAKKYKNKYLSDFRKKEGRAYRQVYGMGNDFYKNFTKDMIRKYHTSYTKDEIIDIAKNFKTKTDFRKKGKGAYDKALDFGPFITNPKTGKLKNTYDFFNSVTSHMEDNSNILDKKLIYAHEFYDDNGEPIAVYVGLTRNSEKRKQEHITGIGHYGKEDLTPVTKFLKENPTYQHNYKELTDYVEPNEAVKMEKYWEHKYFTEGWDILNIAPTGSLGARRKKTLGELKKEVDYIHDVEGVKTLSDFMKKYPSLYITIVGIGLHKPDNENFLLGKFNRKIIKTDDEIMDEVKKYNTYFDFLNDEKLYNNIWGRKLLTKVKEYFNLPIDKRIRRKKITVDIESEQQNEPIEQN